MGKLEVGGLMFTSYNRIAGRSLERLAALSDGIFAVALTILVLDIHAPGREGIESEHDLWMALAKLSPRIVMYLMSFLTLGIFWTGQQTQFNHLSSADRTYSWINITFLAAVSITPFSTALLAEFITFRTALLLYWANILLLGIILYAGWRYARRAKLVNEETTYETVCAIERRIVVGQALYAVGALLCIFSTYWSMGFIVLVQLNYAIAPRIRFLSRL
jgi:uncharacterized membrane protein